MESRSSNNIVWPSHAMHTDETYVVKPNSEFEIILIDTMVKNASIPAKTNIWAVGIISKNIYVVPC